MKYLLMSIIAALFMMLVTSAYAQEVTIKPYQKGDWALIQKSSKGAPLVVHFWGVTCPSCVKEMPQWGQFKKLNPNSRIVFIQVDDVSVESMQNILKKAGIFDMQSYFINGPFDERLRYEIDPSWHGETPTTFFIDRNGKISKKIGAIDFKQLKNFLAHGA